MQPSRKQDRAYLITGKMLRAVGPSAVSTFHLLLLKSAQREGDCCVYC